MEPAKGRRRTRRRVPDVNERRSRKDGENRGVKEEVAQLPSATDDSGPTWDPIKGATRSSIYSEEQQRDSWSRLENVNRTDVSLYRSLKYRLLTVPLPKTRDHSNVARYLVFSSDASPSSLLFHYRVAVSLSFRCWR